MTIKKGVLKNFAIGLPKRLAYGDHKEMLTGICKERADSAFLTADGFKGDGRADQRHHAGPDRAVCLYPYEHYAYWEKTYGHKLPASAFGENMTVLNMTEAEVHIGDIFQAGEAVIQITQGRVPCSTITRRTGLPDLMKDMIQTGYTGYLCRVLKEGMVESDSPITLLEAGTGLISVLEANRIYFHAQKDTAAVTKLLHVPGLAEEWRGKLQKRIHTKESV